jgi:quercetin dioxygenase-like cupin family protein
MISCYELFKSRTASLRWNVISVSRRKHGAPFSAYLVKAEPGQGPPLHTHPYVEVAFTLEGTATVTVAHDSREVNPGSIVVIPANTPHHFVNSGAGLFRQIGIRASPKFIQTNL